MYDFIVYVTNRGLLFATIVIGTRISNTFCLKGITFLWPRSRSYGRTAALKQIVQPCDEDEEKDDQSFSFFQ
jgi:hypothetical protein